MPKILCIIVIFLKIGQGIYIHIVQYTPRKLWVNIEIFQPSIQVAAENCKVLIELMLRLSSMS